MVERIEEQKILGLWLSTYMDFERNTREIRKKAFYRISMLTKLKYVGTSESDLLTIYLLFIRCLAEYCSVVWHSSLTVEQSDDIESIQKVSLRIILNEKYLDYSNALIVTGLETLKTRRENKCLSFGLRCLEHPKHKQMFPLREPNKHNIRNQEKFIVNKARTSYYQNSSIPQIQMKLNNYFKNI